MIATSPSSMTYPKDGILLEIVDMSVRFLLNHCSYKETALFRSAMPQSDVRNLFHLLEKQIHSQLNHFHSYGDLRLYSEKNVQIPSCQQWLELSNVQKDSLYTVCENFMLESDPFLIAEVIQTCLKNLSNPLLHEVYDMVVSTELEEDRYDWNVEQVHRWLLRLPLRKRFTTQNLFLLFSRLAEGLDSTAAVGHLANVISPTLCRLRTTAYMSLRHKEHMKRVVPVMVFVIENYNGIFESLEHDLLAVEDVTPDVPPTTNEATTVAGQMDQMKPVDQNSMVIESSNFVKPNLHVVIPSGEPVLNVSNSTTLTSPTNANFEYRNGASVDDDATPYSEVDWKLLHALVHVRVLDLLGAQEEDKATALSRESTSSSHLSYMNLWSTRQTAAATIHHSPSKSDMTSNSGGSPSPSVSTTNKTPTHHGGTTNPVNRILVRSLRRRLVVDCKALRAKIQEFEQNFQQKYNRVPRSSERGSHQELYDRYKQLKKDIRDGAATDIQRIIRAFLCRRQHKEITSRLSKYSAMKASTGEMDLDTPYDTPIADRLVDGYFHESDYTAFLREYHALLDFKRELKKVLKRFDEQFLAEKGRMPTRADKEIVRPKYERYHGVKNKITAIENACKQRRLTLPPQDTDFNRSGSDHANFRSRQNSSVEESTNSQNTDPLSYSHTFGGEQLALGSSNEAAVSEDFSTMPFPDMVARKRALHGYLKVFEREFQKRNGRPVMRSDDIQPVAAEYQKYKELKQLLADYQQ